MSKPIAVFVAKAKSPWLESTLKTVVPIFLDRGWSIISSPELQAVWKQAALPLDALSVDPDLGLDGPAPELCLVLGGDGTLLSAARRVGIRGTPLLGINLGSLGFITAHPAREAAATLHAYFEGHLERQQRTMLQAELYRQDKLLMRQCVLNDAVLNKGALARIMAFRLLIDGFEAATIKADGLIVATPTGSTAYSLSAGGPILHPSLDAWVISPICPHSLTLRPSVVPGSAVISVLLEDAEDAHLTLDGQLEHSLIPGDRVQLQKSEYGITLLNNPTLPFFRVLQQKLHWSHPF